MCSVLEVGNYFRSQKCRFVDPQRNIAAVAVLALMLFGKHGWAEEPPNSILRDQQQETVERLDPRTAFDELNLLSEPQSFREGEALKKAIEFMQLGENEMAYRQLIQALKDAERSNEDATNVLLLLSQVLLRMNHLAVATQILGVVAVRRPLVDRIQLDYAVLLFALGKDDAARTTLFDLRRRQSLSDTQRRNVESILEQIRNRQSVKLEFDVGFWQDDNVNNAPEDETAPIPALGGLRFTLDQRPVSAWIARMGARLRWQEPVTEGGRLYAETHASIARNNAIGTSRYNRTWARISTGPRLHYAAEIAGRLRPGLLLADLEIRRSWCGGVGCSSGLWTRIGAEQSVDWNWRVGGFPRVWITRYDEGSSAQNPVGRSLDLYVLRRIGAGWLKVGGSIAREKPKDRSLRWKLRSASMRYDVDIGANWGLSVGAGLTCTTFDTEAPLFLTRREDRTRNISLTASHRRLAWEGYLPELTLNWSRTVSSIPLYDRETHVLRLGLRRLF